jgi:polysaccharide deacetylase family protein (PEP-CTERM system associated)
LTQAFEPLADVMISDSKTPLALTVDYELTGYPDPRQFRRSTYHIMRWFEQVDIRATFFCVGEILEQYGDLVCELAEAGHEIACHGWRHVPLTEMTPPLLEQDLRQFLACASELGLAPIQGYRAPYFSLTPDTQWAFEVIAHMGFRYDSSVVPARTILHGHPAMPTQVHQMANGLLEIPVTVVKPLLGWGIPLLGGTYLRLLPGVINRSLIRESSNQEELLVAYFHPYDLDPGVRSINAFPGNPLYNSLLKIGQRSMQEKLGRLMEGRSLYTLAEVCRLSEVADAVAGESS